MEILCLRSMYCISDCLIFVNAYSLTPFIFQLRFASLDLELHTKYKPGASESIYDVDQRVSKKTQVIPPLPEDRFLCGFSHIFAGLTIMFI